MFPFFLCALGMASLLLCVLRMLLDPENMGLGVNVSLLIHNCHKCLVFVIVC